MDSVTDVLNIVQLMTVNVSSLTDWS